jgi:hypothetical protein
MPGFSSEGLRGIFISYRRQDAGPYARSLQRDLRQRFPDARIFIDLDSIEPGWDFAKAIEDAVNSSAVLVALIGRRWATLTDEEGARRLDNPDDPLRFELKTALERRKRVIPVLIDDARPLCEQELPAELHELAKLNAHKLSYDRYQDDSDRLLDIIDRALAVERRAFELFWKEADRKLREDLERVVEDAFSEAWVEARHKAEEETELPVHEEGGQESDDTSRRSPERLDRESDTDSDDAS